MFQTSSLHTDFARQAQHDRMDSVQVARRSRGERRERFAALLAAVVRPFRHTAPVGPALAAERPATA